MFDVFIILYLSCHLHYSIQQINETMNSFINHYKLLIN